MRERRPAPLFQAFHKQLITPSYRTAEIEKASLRIGINCKAYSEKEVFKPSEIQIAWPPLLGDENGAFKLNARAFIRQECNRHSTEPSPKPTVSGKKRLRLSIPILSGGTINLQRISHIGGEDKPRRCSIDNSKNNLRLTLPDPHGYNNTGIICDRMLVDESDRATSKGFRTKR